jgi:hypothetical protein
MITDGRFLQYLQIALTPNLLVLVVRRSVKGRPNGLAHDSDDALLQSFRWLGLQNAGHLRQRSLRKWRPPAPLKLDDQ